VWALANPLPAGAEVGLESNGTSDQGLGLQVAALKADTPAAEIIEKVKRSRATLSQIKSATEH
jgi:hypothetical protein